MATVKARRALPEPEGLGPALEDAALLLGAWTLEMFGEPGVAKGKP